MKKIIKPNFLYEINHPSLIGANRNFKTIEDKPNIRRSSNYIIAKQSLGILQDQPIKNKQDSISYLSKKKSLPPLQQKKKNINSKKQQFVFLQKIIAAKKEKIKQNQSSKNNQASKLKKTLDQTEVRSNRTSTSRSSARSVRSEIYYGMKPTQRHFQQLKKIHFVQRLLLMEPTKAINRIEHHKFYQKHREIRDRISKLQINQINHKINKTIKTQWK